MSLNYTNSYCVCHLTQKICTIRIFFGRVFCCAAFCVLFSETRTHIKISETIIKQIIFYHYNNKHESTIYTYSLTSIELSTNQRSS